MVIKYKYCNQYMMLQGRKSVPVLGLIYHGTAYLPSPDSSWSDGDQDDSSDYATPTDSRTPTQSFQVAAQVHAEMTASPFRPPSSRDSTSRETSTETYTTARCSRSPTLESSRGSHIGHRGSVSTSLLSDLNAITPASPSSSPVPRRTRSSMSNRPPIQYNDNLKQPSPHTSHRKMHHRSSETDNEIKTQPSKHLRSRSEGEISRSTNCRKSPRAVVKPPARYEGYTVTQFPKSKQIDIAGSSPELSKAKATETGENVAELPAKKVSDPAGPKLTTNEKIRNIFPSSTLSAPKPGTEKILTELISPQAQSTPVANTHETRAHRRNSGLVIRKHSIDPSSPENLQNTWISSKALVRRIEITSPIVYLTDCIKKDTAVNKLGKRLSERVESPRKKLRISSPQDPSGSEKLGGPDRLEGSPGDLPKRKVGRPSKESKPNHPGGRPQRVSCPISGVGNGHDISDMLDELFQSKNVSKESSQSRRTNVLQSVQSSPAARIKARPRSPVTGSNTPVAKVTAQPQHSARNSPGVTAKANMCSPVVKLPPIATPALKTERDSTPSAVRPIYTSPLKPPTPYCDTSDDDASVYEVKRHMPLRRAATKSKKLCRSLIEKKNSSNSSFEVVSNTQISYTENGKKNVMWLTSSCTFCTVQHTSSHPLQAICLLEEALPCNELLHRLVYKSFGIEPQDIFIWQPLGGTALSREHMMYIMRDITSNLEYGFIYY